MKGTGHWLVRALVILTLIGSSLMSLRTAGADAPSITVVPVWRPGTQLTTLGPDIRYVNVEIYATSSVSYWAVELTCTVTAAVIRGDYPGSNNDHVTWGPDWGNAGADFQKIVSPFTVSGTTGSTTLTASKMGLAHPMGQNGVTTTQLLATLRYQVGIAAGTSTFVCTTSFLDRNGVSVLTATYTAPPTLTVITGYSITGSVAYQGRTTKTGIGVQCYKGVDLPYQVFTTSTGAFSFTNIRSLGNYLCTYYGNISSFPSTTPHSDLYLYATTVVNLTGQSHSLLPLVLKGGNLVRTQFDSTEHVIDATDLGLLTSDFHANAGGDINGDGKTDKIDLAIASGNFNLKETEVGNGSHVLYGAQRGYSTTGPNNGIWLGDLNGGPVSQFVPGTARNFWPAVSPDGSKIAYTQIITGGNHAIFVSPIAGTPATRISPAPGTANGNFQFFAPSWSLDGNKVAYLCSPWGNFGWQGNYADICLSDATGNNFQRVTYGTAAHMYPPAWLDNHTLVYGGTNNADGACQNTLCKLDLSANVTTAFDGNIPIGSDMPVIRGTSLFYRYSYTIALANITTLPLSTPFGTSGNDFVKNNSNTPVSLNVDYFAASAGGRNLMFTDYILQGGVFTTVTNDYADGSATTWTQINTHDIYDLTVNPPYNPDNTGNVYGERNTVDWEP